MQHGERVAAADEAREREASRVVPVLAITWPYVGLRSSRRSSVPLTPATASEERNASRIARVGVGRRNSPDEAGCREPVELRQARAVDEPRAGERDARLGERRPGGGCARGCGSARRRPPPRVS